ncbi:MAG TPA: S41 family peptidase [Devosia sp.]|jgi:carboxyl-terminal processing protease|uniref:S41 family peptidase n=1 Tax=Devosia sp. TaxID=1871048 RepID=UPI002F922CC5
MFDFRIVALASMFALSSSFTVGNDDRVDEKFQVEAGLTLFGEVFDQIRQSYVDAPDERDLVRAAIQGMMNSLDPHSTYLTQEAYITMSQGLSGEYGGVGLQTEMTGSRLSVTAVFAGSPAVESGIRAGDEIIAIDGITVEGVSHEDAVKRIRGPIGSSVTVSILRKGTLDTLELTLERRTIATSAVQWLMEGDVAVLRVTSFSAQAGSDVGEAIDAVYSQRAGAAPKGIILDLRNNPGGLVEQAVMVADTFMSRGAVVLMRGRVPDANARLDAWPDPRDAKLAGIPLVVLINGASASASEIVAGALQDHGRATVVGTRSYGKGSIQTILPLGPGGAMRLTTARYYTPSNRSIQALGIEPDVVVRQVVPPELSGRDMVPGEWSLSGHITIPGQPESSSGSSAYVPADKEDDTQLQYALRLIGGHERSTLFPPNSSAVG